MQASEDQLQADLEILRQQPAFLRVLGWFMQETGWTGATFNVDPGVMAYLSGKREAAKILWDKLDAGSKARIMAMQEEE